MKTLTALAIAAFSISLAAAQEKPAESKPEAPPIRFQVLQSKRIDLENRALILNRVVPPVLVPAPTAATTTATAEAAESAPEEQEPQKKQEVLFLSATVYDRQVTEVRWLAGQREVSIFTNIDFNLLTGIGGFETDDTIYTIVMGLGNETREGVAAHNEQATKQGWPESSLKLIPPVETFSATRAQYVVAGGDSSKEPPEEVARAFDALHAFYDANRLRLAEEYTKREAARIERERWLKEHPPVPKDTVINYWIGQGATSTIDKRSIGGARP